MLELAVRNTDSEVAAARQLKEMRVRLQCPTCHLIARSALELQELTDNCVRCGRQKL